MTQVAKIALVGVESVAVCNALEKMINEECKTSYEKQIYARVITKIEKAIDKWEANKKLEKQIEIDFK